MTPFEKVYSLYREDCEEVAVAGAVVTVDSSGKVASSCGEDPRIPARSLLKPFQFLSLHLPADRWQVNPSHNRYAPCAGSISANAEQVAGLQAWYRKGKAKTLAEGVKLPPALPLDRAHKEQVKNRGERTIYHTCFSKHVAILEACEAHGWDSESYLSKDHPFFHSLVATLSDLLSENFDEVEWLTDGCLLPTPVLRMSQLADLYRQLANSEPGSNRHWIYRLMVENPRWIGGEGRTDTRLMESNPGLVAKEGADGLLAIGIPSCEGYPKGLGIVVKMSGGYHMKSAGMAAVPVMKALGLESIFVPPPGHSVRYHYEAFQKRPRFWDISPKVNAHTPVWPGDKSFARESSLDVNGGDHLTLSAIHTTLHVGAHTDAPNHFQSGQAGIDAVDLFRYWGSCQVISVRPERGVILPKDVSTPIRASRILFKTSSFQAQGEFNQSFTSLSPELIQWLGGHGVCLVGTDSPSIDAFQSKELPAHKMTLEYSMAILEGVDLEEVPDGCYRLQALPLPLTDADASPVRAVLYP